MTEHNHRRGTRGRGRRRGSRSHYGGMVAHYTEWWQRRAHKKRRQLVRKLLIHERADDIPGNTPKHIRWDYW